jgi:hypothetical protein
MAQHIDIDMVLVIIQIFLRWRYTNISATTKVHDDAFMKTILPIDKIK